MKKILTRLFLISSLALVLNAAAFAGPPPPPPPTPTAPKKAPEIDPGLAISGVSLLVGSLAVMRSRRNK